MSSLAGESALKESLAFEVIWTVRHLIDLLDERAVSIQLGGAPSEAGIDFRLVVGEHEQHHQVKRASGYANIYHRTAWTASRIVRKPCIAAS
jgi:hypothetical protein